MAFARVSARINQDWACGRAVAPRLAFTKAISEAREWAACGCIPFSMAHAGLLDLSNAIHPTAIAAFHPRQYADPLFPFTSFSETRHYSWTVGRDELQLSKVHILADCVYFPYYPKTPPYMHANSSGVAAHPDRTRAIQHGVLELIERDSFMLAYLTKTAGPAVTASSLPEPIQKRIASLRRAGFAVWVRDLTRDLAPVIFVFSQSRTLAFTACAAASAFDVEEALDHALMEVESSVFCRLANGGSKPMIPSQVQFPEDHAALYGQRRYYQSANFLVAGRRTVSLSDVGQLVAPSWSRLVDRISAAGSTILTVDLRLPERLGGNDGLHIVRSIVPGLVPISFGHLQEPLGMQRLIKVGRRGRTWRFPEHYSRIFPHPYT